MSFYGYSPSRFQKNFAADAVSNISNMISGAIQQYPELKQVQQNKVNNKLILEKYIEQFSDRTKVPDEVFQNANMTRDQFINSISGADTKKDNMAFAADLMKFTEPIKEGLNKFKVQGRQSQITEAFSQPIESTRQIEDRPTEFAGPLPASEYPPRQIAGPVSEEGAFPSEEVVEQRQPTIEESYAKASQIPGVTTSDIRENVGAQTATLQRDRAEKEQREEQAQREKVRAESRQKIVTMAAVDKGAGFSTAIFEHQGTIRDTKQTVKDFEKLGEMATDPSEKGLQASQQLAQSLGIPLDLAKDPTYLGFKAQAAEAALKEEEGFLEQLKLDKKAWAERQAEELRTKKTQASSSESLEQQRFIRSLGLVFENRYPSVSEEIDIIDPITQQPTGRKQVIRRPNPEISKIMSDPDEIIRIAQEAGLTVPQSLMSSREIPVGLEAALFGTTAGEPQVPDVGAVPLSSLRGTPELRQAGEQALQTASAASGEEAQQIFRPVSATAQQPQATGPQTAAPQAASAAPLTPAVFRNEAEARAAGNKSGDIIQMLNPNGDGTIVMARLR